MINFLKYKYLYLMISVAVIAVGLSFVFRFGIPLSIDFVGGSKISYSVNSKVVNLRTEALSEEQEKEMRANIDKESSGEAEILLFETVGPSVGKEAVNKTVIAAILGVLAIFGILFFFD